MIKDYFALAFKNLKKRRLRSWLTMLGIFVSVAIIFVLISLSLGFRGVIEQQFEQLGTDKFFIQPKGQLAGPGTESAALLTKEDIKIIKQVSGVHKVSYWTFSPARIESRNQIRFVNVGGLDTEGFTMFEGMSFFSLQEGSFFREGDRGKIVIGSQYSGDSFLSRPLEISDRITVQNKTFRISGILNPVGNAPDDRVIYMPLDEFRELFDIPERIDQIWIQVSPGEDVREVAERVEERLRKSRGLNEKTQDFTIQTPEDLLNSFLDVLQIITVFLVGVATISLLVGAIGIANTMYTSVLERTKEIGVMKSVGAKNSDIATLFLLESGLLGLAGGIIGIILGASAVKITEIIATNALQTNLLQAAFPIWLIIVCLAFAFIIGALSGTLPALQASKISPTVALRYE